MSANGNGQPPAGMQPPAGATDPGVQAMLGLLGAIPVFVMEARGTDSAAEAEAYMHAALYAAQATTTLDPTRLAGGETPEAKKASTPTPSVRDTDRDGKTGES